MQAFLLHTLLHIHTCFSELHSCFLNYTLASRVKLLGLDSRKAMQTVKNKTLYVAENKIASKHKLGR
jgi:hypothetical protein